MVQGQPGQTVHETPISKITTAKWSGVCFAGAKTSVQTPVPLKIKIKKRRDSLV
jgi:hypothetical protein